MDSFSEEYSWRSLTVGFALLFLWGTTALDHAYDRRLAEANESFTQASKVVGRLDVIAEALDHLRIEQQAFLSTGEESFQDGVVESIQGLELNRDMLNSWAIQSSTHRGHLVALSRSIGQVIDTVSESDRVRDVSTKAALAFFDSKEAEISQTVFQTNQLRLEIVLSISDRIRSADGRQTLLGALLNNSRHWQHLAFLKSGRRPECRNAWHEIGCHIPD